VSVYSLVWTLVQEETRES